MSFDDQTHGKGTVLCTNSDCLLQMLVNLLENSVKFTEKGDIRLTLRNDGQRMWFTVEDTGCGIPEDKVGSIFERFVKLDEYIPGTGLGLSVAKSHTLSLNGTIGVESQVGEGSMFWVELPLS